MAKLSDIEGIGATYAEKLKECGIKTVEALLEKGAKPSDRANLAKLTELSPKLISKWVNRADLARIKGIGGEYADLLESSGVDTVPELAQRNAANLLAKLNTINEQKKLVRALPALSKIEDWIEQAKKLPRAIHY